MNPLNRCYVTIFCFLILAGSRSDVTAAPFVPERNAQCVAISHDGRFIATGKSGMSNSEFPPRPHPTVRKCGLIQLWDAQTGQMLRRMQTFGDFTQLQFSRDDTYLISCRLYSPGGGLEMSEVRIWDVASGKSLHRFNRCHGFALSPRGSSLIVLSRSKCVRYDLGKFSKQQQFDALGGAVAINFTPTADAIAGIVVTENGFVVRLCDTESGNLLVESSPLDTPFYCLAISPDQRHFATGHDGGLVLVWDLETLRPVQKLATTDRGRQHPFFSPNGELLGAGSQRNGDVEFFDLLRGQKLQRLTFQRGSFKTYHPRGEEELFRPESDPGRFLFLADGSTFLTGCFGGMIRTVSGQEVRRFSY